MILKNFPTKNNGLYSGNIQMRQTRRKTRKKRNYIYGKKTGKNSGIFLETIIVFFSAYGRDTPSLPRFLSAGYVAYDPRCDPSAGAPSLLSRWNTRHRPAAKTKSWHCSRGPRPRSRRESLRRKGLFSGGFSSREPFYGIIRDVPPGISHDPGMTLFHRRT